MIFKRLYAIIDAVDLTLPESDADKNNDKQEKREAIMIQDIYPMKLDNAFQMKEPDADSRILAFRDRTVYLKNEGEITFLKYHVWVEYCKTHHKKVPGLVYLFSVDDISFLSDRAL